ncbi:unnamed protein product [Bursaphelenchus xylophilus]|uniref:(pine wood nematode) hypothetical protein n=1 Tax=Bursaphelenchus xylophilus TaxID=6326 RepID=A0A1I7RN30_BURXY|nr:unnamed protein product [Bursaphelenchus xylophilus]CAG9087630.1 unnamed protein product [Bursaphelenchus xylophilus]
MLSQVCQLVNPFIPTTSPSAMPSIRSLAQTTTGLPNLERILQTVPTTTPSPQKVLDSAIKEGVKQAVGGGMGPVGWVLMFLLSVLAIFCLLIGAYALYDEKCRSNEVMKQNVCIQTTTDSGPFRNLHALNRRRRLDSSHV